MLDRRGVAAATKVCSSGSAMYMMANTDDVVDAMETMIEYSDQLFPVADVKVGRAAKSVRCFDLLPLAGYFRGGFDLSFSL